MPKNYGQNNKTMCKHTETETYTESYYSDDAEEPNMHNYLEYFRITQCKNCEEVLKSEPITEKEFFTAKE